MGIVGLKPSISKKTLPPKEHIIFSALNAWNDNRFKRYKRKTSLERWTIDRHDTEGGMVRIERVCAKKDLEALASELTAPGAAPPDVDNLDWWDVDSARNEHLDAGKLAAILKLADTGPPGNLEDKILENAVYMILVHTKEDKQGTVTETVIDSFPYTSHARNLTKKMYEDLVFGKDREEGAP
jgi:hypothetical protein